MDMYVGRYSHCCRSRLLRNKGEFNGCIRPPHDEEVETEELSEYQLGLAVFGLLVQAVWILEPVAVDEGAAVEERSVVEEQLHTVVEEQVDTVVEGQLDTVVEEQLDTVVGLGIVVVEERAVPLVAEAGAGILVPVGRWLDTLVVELPGRAGSEIESHQDPVARAE